VRATRRIVEAIRAIHNVSGRSVAIGVSAGVALFPDDGHTFTQLMAAADQAMYDAKRDGGSHVHAHVTHHLGMDRVFDPQRWDAALVFQPWMDVATNRCGGVEALLRRREGAILQDPEMLLECARRTGSQSDVVAWVVGQACRQLAAWRADGIDVPRVSVNVTAADATGPVFPKLVMSLLDEHGVAPSHLQIEIDERTIGHPEPGLLQNLAELRTAGVHVFLDRFGGNGASLKRLSSMPINGIKIDRDLTRDSDRKQNAAMIAGGVAASKVLGLDIIVVGIENAAQTVMWKGGSSQFQGYHYCAPLPAALIEPTLRHGCPQPVRPSVDDED
jgi:predicted signal transduction protein with EAL and GGDEF domain